MILVTITQSGDKLTLSGHENLFEYSKNIQMKFVKDSNFSTYTLKAFARVEDKEYQLTVDSNNIITLDERYFTNAKPIYVSFSLTSGSEVIHLQSLKFRIKPSVGNETTPLPDPEELWEVLVHNEMDSYFKSNYQSKLDDFNTKYSDTVTKYNTVVSKANEVATNASTVASNTAKAKQYMESAQASAESVLNGLGMLIVDGCVCMEGDN